MSLTAGLLRKFGLIGDDMDIRGDDMDIRGDDIRDKLYRA